MTVELTPEIEKLLPPTLQSIPSEKTKGMRWDRNKFTGSFNITRRYHSVLCSVAMEEIEWWDARLGGVSINITARGKCT